MDKLLEDVTDELVSSISEGDALYLYHKLADKFGWAGLFFTRQDVETAWRDEMASQLNVDKFDEPLPDDVWDAVANSRGWDTLDSAMSEYAWQIVYDAVYDVTKNGEK